MKKIVIDPGHGGKDPGAVTNGLQEKDLTMDIARRVRDALGAYQVDVIFTRDEDTTVGLDVRAAIANKLQADYFLSIHVNAGGGTGFESYIYTNASVETENYRNVIHDRVAAYLNKSGFVDRGKKRANFAVLRLTNMPAVLMENLFIDRKEDAARLADPSFRQGMGEAIAAGLVQALELQPAKPPGMEFSMSDAAEKVIIRAGGKTIQGFLVGSRAYGPVRDIAEALGFHVTWYEKDKVVYIQ